MRRGRLSVPLAAQVMALVLVSVLVAQALTVVAVFAAPPLPPPSYGVEAIGRALKGQTIEARGRHLRLTTSQSVPVEIATGRVDVRRSNALAAWLGASPQSVKLVRRSAPQIVLLTSAGGHGGPPPGELGMGPPRHWGEQGGQGGGREYAPEFGPGGTTNATEFIAVWRQTDGSWRVVQPDAEWEWTRRIAIWLIGSALLMGPIAWWFARRITRPIRRFAESAESLGRDPRAASLPLEGPAEIGVAARAFNAMQSRLQRYVSDRISMMGAISHDLRTPLTRMRFKLERAQPELRKAVLADVEQMEAMIGGVLAFIRDVDQVVERERLDLTSLVVCAIDDRMLPEGVIDFSDNAPGPLIIDGDALALRRLVDNLIDNAIKYGHEAHVSVQDHNGEARITIRDDGPGLPQRELEKVFAPFYRSEQTSGAEGMGLGLAIARSIARAHGGDVTLASKGQGLVAEITLPLAA